MCIYIYAVCHSPLSFPPRTKWNDIDHDLFFKLELGLELLKSTDWLSTSMQVGISIDIPIIHSL